MEETQWHDIKSAIIKRMADPIRDVYALDFATKVRLLEQTIAEMVAIKGDLAQKSREYFTIKAEFDTIKAQFDYLKELKSGLQSAIRAESAL